MLNAFVRITVFAAVLAACSCCFAIDQGPLVDSSILDQAGLQLRWQTYVPVKPAEQIDSLYVFGKYLYAITDSNYLFCVNRENGSVRFLLRIASPGLPVWKPFFYEEKLWFMVGNELLVLDPFSGAIKTTQRFDNIGRSNISRIGRNSTHLFIAGSERRLNAINLDGFWREFQVTADDDSIINSLVVNDNRLIFATDTGSVVCITADGPQKLWQYDIIGSIQAPLVRDEQAVYVSTLSTKVYKLDVATGKPLWNDSFNTAAPLYSSLNIGEEVLYQPAGEMGLYAIDKEKGSRRWHLENGVGLVSESGSRAYVMTKPAILVVMDNSKNEAIYKLNFAQVTDFAYNGFDEMIYVSDEQGRIAAIRPAPREY